MAGYYDSSLLLATILRQHDPAACAAAWDGESIRVASLLVRVECDIAIRRLASGLPKRLAARWVQHQATAIDEYIQSLTLKPVDDSVADLIRRDGRLAACRALDAIHLATALCLQPHLPEPLRICTLDRRLRDVATRLGFDVRPTV